MATNNKIPDGFNSFCPEGGMNIDVYQDISGDRGLEFWYNDRS